MKNYYTKKAIDHFMKPKNFGIIKDADGIGSVGNLKCGDLMKIYIKMNKNKIKDVKFHTLGCAAAIATSDVICEMSKGKTTEEALKITYQDIASELGDLPKVKMHCATLAQEGLKSAIVDYEKKKQF